jgi:hypothetical protein
MTCSVQVLAKEANRKTKPKISHQPKRRFHLLFTRALASCERAMSGDVYILHTPMPSHGRVITLHVYPVYAQRSLSRAYAAGVRVLNVFKRILKMPRQCMIERRS